MFFAILIQRILCLFLIIIIVNGEDNTNKKINPNFRHQVEEIEEKFGSEKRDIDDPQGNLVSFLLQNAKEIFNEGSDQTEAASVEVTTLSKLNIAIETTIDNISIYNSNDLQFTQIIPTLTTRTLTSDTTTAHITTESKTRASYSNNNIYEDLSMLTSFDNSQVTEIYDTYTKDNTKFNNENNVAKTEKKEREILITAAIQNFIGNTSVPGSDHDHRRSCILCNNVYSEACNAPKNKLISSITCARDDDMCYSMHTPFGIIDRGCFNANHNMTTYVCSCNLCNYISISEMPFTFDNKRGWSENVIEISRTRRFRTSVFKEMSCLKCEVNTTRDKGDILETANCLEGNIGNIPVEDCEINEICAVKALRAQGYIWRGCLKTPLYNYWWSLCDYDLCNHDNIVSLYDLF